MKPRSRVECGYAPPRDYHDSFVLLAELGVMSPDQAKSLSRAAGLRNRLAHEYDVIDAHLVHEAARAALSDVPEYLRAIEVFISRPR